MRSIGRFETLAHDFRYGLRALRRSPVFTMVAVMSLAIGIGANTAIFGVIHALMLARLPVARPEELVQVKRVDERGNASGNFGMAEYDALSRSRQVSLAAYRWAGVRRVEVRGEAHVPLGEIDAVDANYFALLGLAPAAGRLLRREDEAGAVPVIGVSMGFAERAFGSARAAVGQAASLDGVPFTIVGVTPRAFHGLDFPGSFSIAVPMAAAQRLEAASAVRIATHR
jgi:putative ABC transport system permease protein